MRLAFFAKVCTILSFLFAIASQAVKQMNPKHNKWVKRTPWIFGGFFVCSLIATFFLMSEAQQQPIFPPPKAGDVDLVGSVHAGNGGQLPGGNVTISGGDSSGGAAAGNVHAGPGDFRAGDGGPGGKGGDLVIKGGDIINVGISESTMLALLRDKSIAANRELSDKYPEGYVLLGLVNGKLVYEPKFKDFVLTADWDNTTLTFINAEHTDATITISKPTCFANGVGIMPNNDKAMISYSFRFVENVPQGILELCGKKIFFEVLDSSKGIFVIGVK